MHKEGIGIFRKGDSTDYLYRVALRALIRNEEGEILIVKEKGHDWWSLPGGGLEYSESIKSCLKRELQEEVGLNGDFKYKMIALEEPSWNERLGAMQINALCEVTPEVVKFSRGVDCIDLRFQSLEEIYVSNPSDSRIVASLSTIF